MKNFYSSSRLTVTEEPNAQPGDAADREQACDFRL